MKKKSLITLSLILVAILFSFGCNKKSIEPDEPIVVEESYPKEVSFTDYSSEYNYCQLPNFTKNDSCIIINSNEELKNYIECWNGIYPEVDFTKYSLLLAGGRSPFSPCTVIEKQLQQISDNEYSLYLDIADGTLFIGDVWVILLKVPKLLENATVNLSIDNYPKETPFIDCSSDYDNCRCLSSVFSQHDCIVLNSNEELENHIECWQGTYPEVDFSEYTLLLARGAATSSPIINIEKQLKQISKNEYSFDVSIKIGIAAAPEAWSIILKIPKLPENAIVKLNLKYNY